MKSTRLLAAATLVFSFLGASALQAKEANILFGVSLSMQQYEGQNLSNSYNPPAGIGRLGVDVTNTLGFEARFGVGLVADSEVESGQTIEVSNHGLMGMYAKGKLPLVANAALYGLLGASAFDMSAQSPSNDSDIFKADVSGVSAGVGLESRFFKNWLVNAELMGYSFDSDHRLIAIELGLGHFF